MKTKNRTAKPFKAVEFQRRVRRQLDKIYAGMSLVDREKAMQKELSKDPFWRELLEKTSASKIRQAA